ALLAPAFGQPQEQKKVLSIADVAEQPASAPAWLTATRDYTRSNLRPNDSTISTVCSSHFLTALPAVAMQFQTSTVLFRAGCDIPTGTWLITEDGATGDGKVWRTTTVIGYGTTVVWNPASAAHSGLNPNTRKS
ncbi:MAG: hypothetical protein WAN50_03335, partial [Minisyncoccia bacterium]